MSEGGSIVEWETYLFLYVAVWNLFLIFAPKENDPIWSDLGKYTN